MTHRRLIIAILTALTLCTPLRAAQLSRDSCRRIMERIDAMQYSQPGSTAYLRYMESVMPVLRQQSDATAYMLVCNRYADYIYRHASLDKMKSASRRISEVAENADLPELTAIARRAQAQYMLRLGMMQQAAAYTGEALRACPDYRTALCPSTFSSIAVVSVRTYLATGKADSADIMLRRLDSMLAWMKTTGRPDPRHWLRCRVYALHAAAEFSRGNMTLCREWMERGRKAMVPGVPRRYYSTYFIMRYHIAVKEGRYADALATVEMLLEENSQILPLRDDYLLQRAQLQQRMGQWEKATRSYATYIDVCDRNQRQRLAESLNLMRTQFEFKRAVDEKRAAEHDLMLYTVACGAMAVALVVTVWTMIVLRRKNRHLVRLLRNGDHHRQRRKPTGGGTAAANGADLPSAASSTPSAAYSTPPTDTPVATANSSISADESLGAIGLDFLESTLAYNEPDGGRAALAIHLGVSERTAVAAVSAAAGCSFKTYTNALRLEHSRQLLESRPDLPIAAIATQCGFGTIRSYQSLFKEKYGLSPSQYRAGLG